MTNKSRPGMNLSHTLSMHRSPQVVNNYITKYQNYCKKPRQVESRNRAKGIEDE